MIDLDDGLRIVVGLGNPGKEYEATRHNIGFMLLDHCFGSDGWKRRERLKGVEKQLRLNNHRVVAFKPLTYMNNCGEAVGSLIRFYKLDVENLDKMLVCHDELDLPLGRLRIQKGGGSAGHNGIRSIHSVLGSREFIRLRLGIGRDREGCYQNKEEAVVRWVLGRFAKEERQVIDKVLEKACECIKVWVQHGVERSAQLFNGVMIQ